MRVRQLRSLTVVGISVQASMSVSQWILEMKLNLLECGCHSIVDPMII